MAFIEFRHVKKTYGSKDSVEIKALDGAEFTVEQGELAVILGASGAGKTTALNILGGMHSVTTGEVIVDGTSINQCKGKDLVSYRRNDVGFVFQFYNLVPNLTALENVELAVQVCKNALNPSETLDKVVLLKFWMLVVDILDSTEDLADGLDVLRLVGESALEILYDFSCFH